MKKITVLLPLSEIEPHISAVCYASKFSISDRRVLNRPKSISAPTQVQIFFHQSQGQKNKPDEKPIGLIMLLPLRDNSIITFNPESPPNDGFNEFTQLVTKFFKDMNLLVETRAEPWRKSSPAKKERDKTIWDSRNLGETWERVAELAECGKTTAVERYLMMLRSLDDE